MKNLVKIKLHGILGEQIGKEEWVLDVNSVSQAINGIEILSGRKLYKNLLENDKHGIRYKVLLNERGFLAPEPLDIDKPETILNSELVANKSNLKRVDIVPVVEGADSSQDKGILGTVLGAILIVVGIVVAFYAPPLGAAIIVAGLGLLAAGITVLLSKPPSFSDFREIDGSTGRTSYLFNGPENTTREGGPVPVGYGELMVGSQVISAAFVINDINA